MTLEGGLLRPEGGCMKTSPHDMLASHDFKRLVFRRWIISTVLTLALFVIYYGYIVLIATNKPFMAQRIGDGATTLGIPLGIAVIVVSWALTAGYVVWANTEYDREVRRLKDKVMHDHGRKA
jgi:uncharacterized membrane protein (DUF485 family)